MSAAAKKAVGERMKAYWLKRKATVLVRALEGAPATPSTPETATEKPALKAAAKRTLSPDARARISAAVKERWRVHRKANKAA